MTSLKIAGVCVSDVSRSARAAGLRTREPCFQGRVVTAERLCPLQFSWILLESQGFTLPLEKSLLQSTRRMTESGVTPAPSPPLDNKTVTVGTQASTPPHSTAGETHPGPARVRSASTPQPPFWNPELFCIVFFVRKGHIMLFTSLSISIKE